VLVLILLCSTSLSAQISYSQDFTSTTHGWTGASRSITTSTACGTSNAHLRYNLWSSAPTGNFTSPSVGASNGGIITLTYDYKITNFSGGAATPNTFGSFVWEYQVDNGSWNTVAPSVVSSNHVPSTSCVTNTATFAVPPSTATKIRLSATWAQGDYYISLDNVSVAQGAPPSCAQPGTPSISNVTNSSASFSWTSQSSNPTGTTYEYEIRSSGSAGSGAIGLTNFGSHSGLSKSIYGLTGGTAYTAYVRSICAAGDTSLWSATSSFTTLCDPQAAPYVEDFETSTTSNCLCWTETKELGNASWTFATGAGGGTILTAHGGTKNARYVSTSGSGTPVTKLISPMIDITSLTDPRLEFYYGQQDWAGDQNELKVYYRVHPASSWVLLAHYTSNVSTWQVERIPIPTTAKTPFFQIAFEGINDFGRANVVDDVKIENTPVCFSPDLADITFTAITDSSATVNWIANTLGTPLQFEIEVREAGSPQGSSTGLVLQDTVTSATLTLSLSGLSSNLDYTVYIRGLCATSEALWVSKDFKTLCSPYVLPFLESFDGWNYSATGITATLTQFDNCWAYGNIPATTTYDWFTSTSTTPSLGTGPTATSWPTSTKYIFVEASNGSNGDEAILTLPAVEVNGYAKISTQFHAYSSTGTLCSFVYIEQLQSGTWVAIDSIVSDYGQSWQLKEVGFNGSGIEQFRIRAVKQCAQYGDVAFDEFEIISDPCPRASSLNVDTVTSWTSTISWDSSPVTLNSAVVWGPTGFTPGTGINGGTWSTGSSPYNIAGLMSSTTYDVYVYDSCSGNLGYSAGPISFTTLAAERDLKVSAIYNATGSCGDSSSAVYVAVKNVGRDTATGYDLVVTVTDPNGAPTTLTGTSTNQVPPAGIDSVFIGTYNSILGGVFDIQSVVSSYRDTIPGNDTLTVSFSYLPYMVSTYVPDTFCQGVDSVLLSAVPYPGASLNWYSDPTGLNLVGQGPSLLVPFAGPSTYYVKYVLDPLSTFGNGTVTGTGGTNTPFYTFYEDQRMRVMILASELTAAGYSAGNITEIGLEVVTVGALTVDNFNIQLWDTNSVNIGSVNDPAPSSAHLFYSNPSYQPTVGYNAFNGTPFYWNGTDNIVVQFCFDNSAWSSPATSVKGTSQATPLTAYGYADGLNGCSDVFSNASTGLTRPDLTIIIPSAPCTNSVLAPVSFITDTLNSANADFTVTWLNSYQYAFDGTASLATSFVWDFGDGYTNSSSLTPTHTFATSGTYDVTLTVFENQCNTMDSLTQQVNYFIGQEEDIWSFKVYPNPTSGLITIQSNELKSFEGELRVYNSVGMKVIEQAIDHMEDGLSVDIDLTPFSKGLYQIVIESKEGQNTFRVVLQ
jgi:hypothetical protein